VASVLVGLEPIAVAEDPDGRVWVVNHLSDSISVVDVAASPPRVVQTLWVGDEPRDIVFAGENRERAFITTAHRGQNSPVNPALNTPGVGRADVWVFDSSAVDDTPGGSALDILTLFGDRPRPLAVSADGLRVFAGIFLSGNQTTSVFSNNFPKNDPQKSADGATQPDSAVIVKFNGANWIDETGQNFNNFVPFRLPDYDLFEIDAVALTEIRKVSGVGTTLFNIAVNPITDTIYVSNMDARNNIRFAGKATRASTTVRGHVTDQQITVVQSGTARKRVLNKHLDFSNPEASAQDRNLSVHLPLGMAISADGGKLYVAAFGSGKIVVYDTAALEDDSFSPGEQQHIAVSGGGPSGVALDENNNRAYVLTRFDNGISTIDLTAQIETNHLQMFNPEPQAVTNGRKFLYDATLTSGNGNDSCGSCHLFGDSDALAWDLGDPDGVVKPNQNVFIPISRPASPESFHSMKGPMATQSMRGTKGHGPMHWRGDRMGVNRVGGETLEEAAFKEFNEAFDALAGLGRELSAGDMQAFTDFAMEITYPPNPIRQLDNKLVGIELRGQQQFVNGVVRIQTGVLEVCIQCHVLDPAAGLFGSKGLSSDNTQAGERNMKIPHFRDQYQKVGMFGFGFNSPTATGNQVRGFSFNHNGSTSSNFIIADLGMPKDDLLALRAYLYAFPTESPPITGQQVTLVNTNGTEAAARIDLLVDRGLATLPVPGCDLVVSGVIDGVARSWAMERDGQFRPHTKGEALLGQTELQALVSEADDRLTWMCTPWGSGARIGIDRDLDGVLDGDEL
jgi:DNA-binding beta-propeller fold protein YncE